MLDPMKRGQTTRIPAKPNAPSEEIWLGSMIGTRRSIILGAVAAGAIFLVLWLLFIAAMIAFIPAL
jgi:hypothetical protein